MELVIILGASQAFFLGVLAFSKKNKSNADWLLACWLLYIGLTLFYVYLHDIRFVQSRPYLLNWGTGVPLLHGAFLFVYILLLTNKSGNFKRTYWLHALPFLLVNIYFVFDFHLLSPEEKLHYYSEQFEGPYLSILIAGTLNVLVGPFYFIWSLVKLRMHERTISNEFSFKENVDLRWLKNLLYGFGMLWMVVIIANLLSDIIPVFSSASGESIINGTVAISVFFLGYFGIRQPMIYSGKDSEKTIAKGPNKESQYQHSGLTDADAEKHLQKLLDYMTMEKPYLDGKLSMKTLSTSLDISTYHLSQVINERLDKNFFVFTNEFRVEEFKRLITSNKQQQFTLLALAYNSGFNSKSSFNNIFKKITGYTPTEYIKTQNS